MSGWPVDRQSLPGAVGRLAFRSVLDRSWDTLIYVCVGTAILTAAVCALVPHIAELVAFGWLMFLTSGPTATFLPSASEPLLMAFGRLHSPLLLAVIAVSGIALVEWLNFRVFRVVVLARSLSAVREARVTRRLERLFGVQPFTTTVVSAMTPIPFWVVRVCAVSSGYAMGRFIMATAIGRFPRVWFVAFIGTTLPFSATAILLVGAVLVLTGAGVAAHRRTRARARLGMPTRLEVPEHVVP